MSNAAGSQRGFASAFGYQEDAESGLKLLGHRYYDAATGRFITRDPSEDGSNWYAYCDNNPLKAIDADGLKKTLVIIIGNTSGIEPGTLYKLMTLMDEFSSEYDIRIVMAANPKAVQNALASADAAVMIGHGWPFSTRKGTSAGSISFNKVIARRRKGHRPKLDFLIIFSCNSCTDESDRVLYLKMAKILFGFDDLWWTEKNPSIWKGGHWWQDPRGYYNPDPTAKPWRAPER